MICTQLKNLNMVFSALPHTSPYTEARDVQIEDFQYQGAATVPNPTTQSSDRDSAILHHPEAQKFLTFNPVSAGTSPCCAAVRLEAKQKNEQFLAAAQAVPLASCSLRNELHAELREIPGGFFEMGARKATYAGDFDAPRRKVHVSPFLISPVTVTNAKFARFIAATGYRTVAETEGWSFVFHMLLDDPSAHPEHPPGIHWWRCVKNASWQNPEGQGSNWRDRAHHPVTHVAWFDALAYTRWAGLRLPLESEWERAARGRLKNMKFPWGNTLVPKSGHAMNVWQGTFPYLNTVEDGYLGTAPVDEYQPNDFGLYNMTGNVWEWVEDSYCARPGTDHDFVGPPESLPRVQRGGSFLCHASYCSRYHVHSRTRNAPDSSTSNTGFRVATDI